MNRCVIGMSGILGDGDVIGSSGMLGIGLSGTSSGKLIGLSSSSSMVTGLLKYSMDKSPRQ